MLIHRHELQLSILVLSLLCFEILSSNISAQPTLQSIREVNVTQDLLDLLAQASETSNNSESNNQNYQLNSSGIASSDGSDQYELPANDFILRNSESIFLEDKHLPESSIMTLVNTSPFKIIEAQITSRLPCDENNNSVVEILIGNPSNYSETVLEFLGRYSEESNLCIYKNVISDSANEINEIALSNNGTEEIEFPPTSTIMIGPIKLSETTEPQK